MLTLRDAVKAGRIADFIVQEKSRGIGPIDRKELDRRIASLIKSKQPKDQTSHSASRDDSTGKRTRQGSGQRTSR